MGKRTRLLGVAGAAALVIAMVQGPAVGARPASLGTRPAMALKPSVDRTMARLKSHVRPGDPSHIDCTITSPDTSNVNLDCDDPGFPGNAIYPNNEEHIVVDPLDPNHMIVSSNDYSSCCDEWYTTFDGGFTWTTGDISKESNLGSGFGSDPVTAIDPVHGTAIHSSLNIHIDEQSGDVCNWDVVASISTDGGITWDPNGEPVIVYAGQGCESTGSSILNDKEWIGTDTNPNSGYYGRTYMTWTRFKTQDGFTLESPIWESHSDDGGYTWSNAQEISGDSKKFCTYQVDGPSGECDEDQGSTITVGPDGTVTVAFINEQNQAAWEPGEMFENQQMVVQSHNGGVTWTAPVHVVDMEDGSADFPINVDGRQTLTGYQLRVWGVGNVAADPSSGRLALVFMDNRNGTHDVAHPQTNTDVFLMTSNDGISWFGPKQITRDLSDQLFPSVAFDPTQPGHMAILYHARNLANTAPYNTYVATGAPGLGFVQTKLTNKLSHPRQSLFFTAGPGAPGCRHCATFFGDYISLAYGSDGSINATWTDMRRFGTLDPVSGYLEDSFFSRI
jgi:hypothetical protein